MPAESAAGRSPTDPHAVGSPRALRGVLLGFAVLMVVGLAVLGVAPVHVIVGTQHEAALRQGSVDPSAHVVRDDLRVSVTLTGASPVEITLPPVGASAPAKTVVHADEGWRIVRDVAHGNVQGGLLELRALTRSLPLQLSAVSAPTSVRVRSGSRVLDVALSGSAHETVSVVSGRREHAASERFEFRSHSFELPTRGAVESDSSYVALPVDHTVDGGPSRTVVTVGVGSVLSAFGGGLADVLPLLALAVAAGLVSIVLGGALLSIVGGNDARGCDSLTVRFAVGLATPVLCVGALHYVAPVFVGVALTTIASAVVVLLAWRRAPSTLAFPRRAVDGPVVLVALLATLVTVVVAVLARRMNVGLLQTDIYDYFHLSDEFWDTSIASAGRDWGDGLRVIDSSWRAAIEGVTGLQATDAALTLRLLLVAAVPLAIGEAARRSRASAWCCALVAGIAAFSAPLLALWVEGYLSRELFASLTLVTLAAAVVMLAPGSRRDASSSPPDRGPADERRRARPWIGIGAVAALPAATVPPYSTVVFGILVGTLGAAALRTPRAPLRSRLRGIARRAYELSWFAIGFVATVVVNLWWMRNSEVAADYARGVRLIGLNVVVPFHDSGRYPAALLGVLPFHANRQASLGLEFGEWIPGPLARTVSAIDRASESYVWVGLFALLMVVVAVAAIRRGLANRDARPGTLVLASTLAITIVGFLVTLPLWEDQSFFTLMWGWTLAPLGLVCFALLVVNAADTMRPVSRIVGIGTLAVLLLANIGASAFETTRWLENPALVGARTHFGLAPALADLHERSDRVARDSTGFVFDAVASDLSGTDDDRVLINFIELELRDAGLQCKNCVTDERNGSVLAVTPRRARAGELVVVPGGTGCGADQPRFASRSFVICKA